MRVSHEGRASKTRFGQLRDSYKGESCVILGNGPSLKGLDLKCLDGLTTFCLNRGYLLWQESGRLPAFFVAVNDLVIKQFHEEISALPCPLFLPWQVRGLFRSVSNAVFFEERWDQRFMTDVRRGISPCATVTMVALQLAYHMGFKTVVLLGIDHRFTSKGPAHAEVCQEGDDLNHFHPDYFGSGTLWNLPDLEQSEMGYRLAQAAFEKAGRRIINATPGTALGVFETAEFAQALARLS